MSNPKKSGRRSCAGRNQRTDCGGPAKESIYSPFPDVTVYDYAHVRGTAPAGVDRPRKAERHNHRLNEVQKEFAVCANATYEALDWDERTLDSFDDEIDALITQKSEGGLKPGRLKKLEPSAVDGSDYPLDLWFLIGAYIHPEDVGRFAAICPATHMVTHTAHFWRQLYKRIHSRYRSELPADLEPRSLERIHGLRARVIRSLYHVYPRYLNQTQTIFSDDLTRIEGLKCLSAWTVKKSNKSWHIYFKFKAVSDVKCNLAEKYEDIEIYEGYHLLKGFSDLHHNKDDGCYILKVAAASFTSVTECMGLYLISIGVNVSRTMRYHKLNLVLDSRAYMRAQSADSVVLCIDPASNAKLYPWWKPGYYDNS